jgi:nitrite reductase (NO-forming)/hydroxylamine reductase
MSAFQRRVAGYRQAFPVILGSVALLVFVGACRSGEREGGEAMTVAADQGKEIYDRVCFACHSIGEGPRIGPDLKDIHQVRDHDWLVRWLRDPVGMTKTDSIGRAILAEWNNVPMVSPNLNDEEIDQVLDYITRVSEGRTVAASEDLGPVELTPTAFEEGSRIYFDRCAGCHGTLRAGATGPNIQPERTTQIGTAPIRAILANGTPGGMPPWGRQGILSADQLTLMAKFIQLPPPDPPQRPLSEIRASWSLKVPVASRPKAPQTKRNWENYFGVILRDAGQVAIIDGDTYEHITTVETGFAVHILRSSSTGRYFYAIGRDGRVTLIDLWTETPTLVAQVQGCTDARSVEGSKYPGYEDRYLIEGCYWPPQYVVYDGLTLEPLSVTDVGGSTYDTNEPLTEVRVAAIVASHNGPVWMVALKESGFVAIVDYSKTGFPIVSRIAAERFLHDGGWDQSGRYFLVAANMRNKMVVIDAEKQELVAAFETGIRPHP